ncbi:unnamed protein product [Timema podura]|uniref:Probable RNA polymerase II nuclear localization protein SLC7A6OS n=1 Tax=Timema podura TaxID=61482 RepID=A0ABN7P4Y5_TIMPD|nr:unnamed protein product [Timema podura]
MGAEENDHYVYDLYYTGDVDDMLIENLVSVQPLQSDLLYHRRSSSGLSDSDDSEDSNAENNIGNDYPDTEEDNSIDEDDMRAAIRMEDDRFDDLSSDDEDALRISDLKLDPDDVEKYGISRAFCKASKKGDYDEDDYYFDMDSDSDESRIGKVEFKRKRTWICVEEEWKTIEEKPPRVHPTEIRTSISPSSAALLNTKLAR